VCKLTFGVVKSVNMKNALLSLDGLSVGDAFGESFFGINPTQRITSHQVPNGIWGWTDDTHMALSIVETLDKWQRIEPDYLISRFCARYINDKRLGYGAGTRQLLERAYFGENWRVLNNQIFRGGSYGNGAAMRVAPIGAYFSGDLERTAYEAKLSAEVTHAHIEGIAGAMAVAVAASIASQASFPRGNDFLHLLAGYIPDGLTKDGILRALDILPATNIEEVTQLLGNGGDVSAQDTVPFCLWCASHHLDNFEEALWTTVSGLGDRDTTCAIVGGIVALSSRHIPESWLQHREPLLSDFVIKVRNQ
jgi:ADP-ribosylglycohydrolase